MKNSGFSTSKTNYLYENVSLCTVVMNGEISYRDQNFDLRRAVIIISALKLDFFVWVHRDLLAFGFSLKWSFEETAVLSTYARASFRCAMLKQKTCDAWRAVCGKLKTWLFVSYPTSRAVTVSVKCVFVSLCRLNICPFSVAYVRVLPQKLIPSPTLPN